MADARKEYEMLFKLGAQLGSNFQGTFSSAQQVLSDTQKKVQALNRLQSDITAYQRQQTSLDKSQQKLELYKNQLANTQNALAAVRKEMESSSASSANLAARESELLNRELALKNRINDTELAISDKNSKLRQMEEKLSSAGVSTDNLTSEIAKLNGEITNLRDTEEKASSETALLGEREKEAAEAVKQRAAEEKALAEAAKEAARQRAAEEKALADAAKEAARQKREEQKAADEAAKVAAAGAAATLAIASKVEAGLKKVYDSFKDCVTVASRFESTMSTVEALSGSSASEMSALTAEAKRLGAETVFTAEQSATAMTYMGMAGWKAQEMLNGMNGVMSLAAASGEDLGLVSDIVTDNLTAFGLTAKDTAHFSDVLAAAATNSNTSVGIMGETFSGSAAVAGALGYSIEDVAVAVGAMANAGVKGSVAGTALKNIFNGLLEGVTLTGKAFGEYEFTAVNADGTMKGFGETLNELRVYFDQMTESERANNAMALAGQRGYNGLLAILNTTGKDYEALTNQINNCSGAAQRMADVKLDNLSGDVTLLQSAAEGLKISIGSLYRDELRGLAQMSTQILGTVQKFIEENPAFAKAILLVAGGIGAIVGAYTALNALKKAKNALDTISTALRLKNTAATAAETIAMGANAAVTKNAAVAQTELNAAMMANPVGILIAGIGILGTLIASAIFSWQEATAEVDKLTEKAREFDAAMEEANSNLEQTNTSIASNVDTADFYIDKLEEIEAATNGNVESNEEYHNILTLLSQTVPELAEYIDLETNSIVGGTEALRQHTEAYRKDAEEQARQEYINTIYSKYGDVIKEVAENKIKLAQSQLKEEQALANAEKTQKRMNELMAEAEALANGEIDAAYFLTDEYYDLETALHEYNIEAGLAKDEQENFTNAISKGEETINRAKEEIDLAVESIEKSVDATKEATEETTTAYAAVDKAIKQVKEETEALITAYTDAYTAAYESVSGQYALWDTAATVVPTSISTINSALSSQVDYWDKYNENLESIAKRADGIEGLSDIIAGFADGSKDSVNAIAGMANASDAELKKMVETYAKLKEEQDKTSKSLADVKTDFETQMDEISAKMSETVSEMKLDDEAAAAAKATIQAYADALLSGRGMVVEAADAVQQATTNALNSLKDDRRDGSPEVVVTPSANGGPSMVSYYGIGAKYAEGTDYAKTGYALVGEEGPEIVYMNGGEKVVNAESTRAILGGSSQSTTITISPIFTINNNGGEIDEKQASELSERLVASVMEALEEAGIDRKRAVFA